MARVSFKVARSGWDEEVALGDDVALGIKGDR
jgi:hypothetical protein